MAATLRMDTLKFVRKLTDAGMDRQAAEALADGIAEVDMSDLATKADLQATKSELRLAIAGVRTEIAGLRSEMFRFMLLQAMGIVGLTVTLIKVLP